MTAHHPRPYFMISSMEKGLKVMELLAERGELSVSEVASHLGIHRSAAHRFLATLRELGYATTDSRSRYRLTFHIFELGMRVANALEIKQVSAPYMLELARLHGDTVNLGRLIGDHVMYLDKIEGRIFHRIDLAVGTRVPVYCSALGKSILAFRPAAELEELLSSINLTAHTPNTIINIKRLRQSLEEVRVQGYAVDDEELFSGIRCIAAPVFDFSGLPLHSLSLAGPTSRMTKDHILLIKEDLMKVCRELSERMGSPAPSLWDQGGKSEKETDHI